MSDTCTPEAATLHPAYSLVLRGLNPDAAMEKLRRPLSQMLDVSPASLPQLLEHPPLYLGQSQHRNDLELRLQRLAGWGCDAGVEPIWRYRHWTLSQALVDEFDVLRAAGSRAVFALLYIKPLPGFTLLQRISGRLQGCRPFCLNHGQLLLQLELGHADGAGKLLLEIQQQLELGLSEACESGERMILSSLALFPEDAETAVSLLDALAAQLLHFAKNEPAALEPENPRRVLARPLAGRPWARLVEQGLSEQDKATLAPEALDEIRRHWPLGKEFMAEFGVPGSGPGLPRFRAQFDASSLKRVERCWGLLHDSQHWDNLPSLPDLAMKIYDLAQDDDVQASELTSLVSSDPALSARILALVNSTYYGLKQKVDSLSHALIILGTEELAELALLLSTESVFSGPGPEFGNRLWRHSAMTAEITRALAHKLNWAKPSALYAAALLHDVGKILLHSAYKEEMQELERVASMNQLPMHEVEREFFGHDHASLGALVLRRWGLPEYLCQRVEEHHGPLPGETQISEAAALIGVADHLAHRLVRSESWADEMRLRRIHALTLKSEFGELDLEKINNLLQSQGTKLRSARL